MVPFAANIIDILKLENVSNLAVAEEAVVYSKSFPLPDGNPTFSFEYQFGSEGSVAAKLELEQGNQELTAAEEGASNDNFVVPEGASEIDDSVADALTHIKAFSPAATAFARVKITGLSGNDASTVLNRLKVVFIK